MTPSITLYAELLLHIRTVTLFASLRTAANRETKATLVEDGETITVKHDGEEASIRLPTRVSGGGDATLTIPQGERKELTLRLQLEEKNLPGTGLLQLRVEEREGNFAPWGAAELTFKQLHAVKCKSCNSDVLRIAKSNDQPGVSEWKDLPNENWAEMMDFWHCHKPDDHNHGHADPPDEGNNNFSDDHNGRTPVDDAKTKDKGYAASTKLRARSGTGFIDLTHLLLHQDDCFGMKTSSSNHLLCHNCDVLLGKINERVEGWELYKWALALDQGDAKGQSYSTQRWLSAQFLGLIENEAVRKFVVRPEVGSQDDAKKSSASCLKLWVFTPDLSFCSSVGHDERKDPTRAMKVFWQPLTQDEAVQSLDEGTFSLEEVVLPQAVVTELKNALETSGELLPASSRTFQGWKVALLERFSRPLDASPLYS